MGSIKISELESVDLQSRLRASIFDAITEQDVVDMVRKQVEKAKAGDAASLQFVMKYLLGFGSNQVVHNQVNVVDVEAAARIANERQLQRSRLNVVEAENR